MIFLAISLEETTRWWRSSFRTALQRSSLYERPLSDTWMCDRDQKGQRWGQAGGQQGLRRQITSTKHFKGPTETWRTLGVWWIYAQLSSLMLWATAAVGNRNGAFTEICLTCTQIIVQKQPKHRFIFRKEAWALQVSFVWVFKELFLMRLSEGQQEGLHCGVWRFRSEMYTNFIWPNENLTFLSEPTNWHLPTHSQSWQEVLKRAPRLYLGLFLLELLPLDYKP